MKYIRTKEKIITESTYEELLIGGYNQIVINQADTIEELCDEFVWREITFDKGKDYEGYDCLIDQDYERDEHEITQDMIREGIYGAIWTDKGLQFVARMNSEGDFEIL